MAKGKVFNLILVLQICLGIFFLVSGIIGCIGIQYDRLDTLQDILNLAAQILMIVCGVIVLVALFMGVKPKVVSTALWIVFVLWLVTIILNIIECFNQKFSLNHLLDWLKLLSQQFVILASILIVKDRN